MPRALSETEAAAARHLYLLVLFKYPEQRPRRLEPVPPGGQGPAPAPAAPGTRGWPGRGSSAPISRSNPQGEGAPRGLGCPRLHPGPPPPAWLHAPEASFHAGAQEINRLGWVRPRALERLGPLSGWARESRAGRVSSWGRPALREKERNSLVSKAPRHAGPGGCRRGRPPRPCRAPAHRSLWSDFISFRLFGALSLVRVDRVLMSSISKHA